MTFIHDGTHIPTAPHKDPDDTMSWGTDWSQSLASGEIITKSEWIIIPASLTVEQEDFTSTTASILLSGGTIGITYLVTNRIQTRSRIEDRSMYIPCFTK